MFGCITTTWPPISALSSLLLPALTTPLTVNDVLTRSVAVYGAQQPQNSATAIDTKCDVVSDVLTNQLTSSTSPSALRAAASQALLVVLPMVLRRRPTTRRP